MTIAGYLRRSVRTGDLLANPDPLVLRQAQDERSCASSVAYTLATTSSAKRRTWSTVASVSSVATETMAWSRPASSVALATRLT